MTTSELRTVRRTLCFVVFPASWIYLAERWATGSSTGMAIFLDGLSLAVCGFLVAELLKGDFKV